MEGDNNTAYFMARASGRRRKTKKFSLNQEEGMIVGDKHILDYATVFYKKLFRPSDSLSFSLDVPVNKVLDDDRIRIMLDSDFTLEEVKHAVFSMRRNRAPGPDGFPIEFYQNFWYLVCQDLMHLFRLFYDGKLNIDRFNYGKITLLPKGEGADKIQMYRPICLSNTLLKIFTKVLNNRAMLVADNAVDLVQSAFIKGRYILDDVVLLHETLHEINKKKE